MDFNVLLRNADGLRMLGAVVAVIAVLAFLGHRVLHLPLWLAVSVAVAIVFVAAVWVAGSVLKGLS